MSTTFEGCVHEILCICTEAYCVHDILLNDNRCMQCWLLASLQIVVPDCRGIANKMVGVLSKEACDKVRQLCEQYESDKNKVVPCQQQIARILISEGAAKRSRLMAHQVVAHKHNRDGQMLTASGVQVRATRLQSVGFSKSVLEQGTWCFQDHPVKKHLATAALQHYDKDDRYARYRAVDVVAGSVGASLTTHVIASVKDERPCDSVGISTDGRYDKLLWYSNEDFQDCAENGFEWWEVKWEIEEEFPMVPIIFQSALNTQQHVAEGFPW
jgi:hypothetical protein